MSNGSRLDFSEANRVLHEALRDQAFPCVAAEAGRADGPLWRTSAGRLSDDSTARPAGLETVFDLASLTKPIATTTLVLKGIESGRLGLDDPAARWLPHWRGRDREAVTVGDLLAHSAGLTAHLPLYRDHDGRRDFETAICTLPLEYDPRTGAVYSDLGFILLGFILADAVGPTLDAQFEALRTRLGLGRLTYRPPTAWRADTAPTGLDAWRGRVLVGEVHDRNAWALGGVAGHAGLFGTVEAVGAFARAWLSGVCALPGESSLLPAGLARSFIRRTAVPGSSRALGWDTMLPTSSCGTLMSPAAFGHTGYTGTSLWIDPARDLYVVLLTNRVHPTDDNEAILGVRPRFHDAIVRAIDGHGPNGRT